MNLQEELQKLKDEEFLLKMKDRWNNADFDKSNKLNKKIKELEEKLNGK